MIKTVISREKYKSDAKMLAKMVAQDMKENKVSQYTHILAIGGGGIPLAYHIAKGTGIQNVSVCWFESYDGEEKKELKELHRPIMNIGPDSKILIVDDLIDTGDTLTAVGDIVQAIYGKRYGTATLYRKSNAPIRPEYYVEKLSGWVVFPYEE